MTKADLPRARNRNRSGPQKIFVVVEQLVQLIVYTSGLNNISKDLKQGLLKLRKSVAMTKTEYNLLAEERNVVDASKEERSHKRTAFS